MIFFVLVIVAKMSAEEYVRGEVCSQVTDYISQFRQIIATEKVEFPKGPMSPPGSVNAIVEKTGDVQRIFEYINGKLNISNLQENEQSSLKQEISSCPSFQELVTECRSIITEPECDPASPYRTFDGTCNNLHNPRWGSLFAQYRRLLPASYKGVSDYRQSVTGGPLPEPRTLNINILRGDRTPSKKLSNMFVFFGQFVIHDTTDMPIPKINAMIPPCCTRKKDSTWCDPIKLEQPDPYYNDTCLFFMRHPPFTTCELGKREFMNSVPSYLDCHITYGRTEEEAIELRTDDNTGRLKAQNTKFGELLVANFSQDDQFCSPTKRSERKCFFDADSRVNHHSMLMSLETLFMREHNRIAVRLREINPHWDGAKIYQEARKINGAKMQCITYKQYLPHLLGENAMVRYGLNIGGVNQYDASLMPNVVLELIGFGIRLHPTINTQVGKSGCSKMNIQQMISNVEPLYRGCLENFMKESTKMPQLEMEPGVASVITDFYKVVGGNLVGLDLSSMDIKRGRDIGSPSYADMLGYVLGETIQNFSDLQKVMPEDKIQILKDNYKDVRDVDPWIGMLMEDHVPGSILGPTVFNLTVDHFMRQKVSDRFYFENLNLPNSFTADQINEIQKCSLSKMICDNSKVKRMPIDPFLLPSPLNPKTSCKKMEEIDLSLWKESKSLNKCKN